MVIPIIPILSPIIPALFTYKSLCRWFIPPFYGQFTLNQSPVQSGPPPIVSWCITSSNYKIYRYISRKPYLLSSSKMLWTNLAILGAPHCIFRSAQKASASEDRRAQHPAPSTHIPFLIATLFALLKTSGFERGGAELIKAHSSALLKIKCDCLA